MEGIVIVAILIGVVAGLAVMARNKVGVGDASDIAAQRDIPRRPVSPGSGPGWGGPGQDFLDDKPGDAGVRARVE